MIFSIVTVVLNDIDGLRHTFDSVAKQTCVDFQHIVIDGCSVDGGVEFANEYKKSRSNVLVVSEKDGGIYDAMNRGLAIVEADYVVFLNAGDVFSDESVLSQVADSLASTPADLLYGDCFESVDKKTVVKKKAKGHLKIDEGMFANHQSMFFRTEFLRAHELSYRLDFKVGGDYAFASSVFIAGGVLRYMEMPICIFNMDGLSNRRKALGRRDNWIIQRDILRINLPKRLKNQLRYRVASILSAWVPSLYARIRYE